MENEFQRHITEWREMNQMGRFAEARQYYFEQLFDEVIDNFIKQNKNSFLDGSNIDVLFSVLGFTPEPIILAARALNPKRHIIFHDSGVKFNEDNMRYLSKFLDKGFEKIELPDESFATIYDVFKSKMAITAGRNYAINVSGGKKSMVAAASIFARDFNCSVIYVDYHNYDANLRRPIPGTEYLNVVYTPLRDLPELFHISINDNSTEDATSIISEEGTMFDRKQKTLPFSADMDAEKVEYLEDTSSSAFEDESSETKINSDKTLCQILNNRNWTALNTYLNKNLQGANIPKIQSEVTEVLSSFTSTQDYWEVINELLSYNSVIFLGSIVKGRDLCTPNIGTINSPQILDSIISKAFENSSKLKFALELLMPCKTSLSKEQKTKIIERCKRLPSSDSFYTLFKLTGMNPNDSIDYLLKLKTTAAAFTLYKIYSDGQKNGLVSDTSPIESLRPSKIEKCCERIQNSASYAFRTISLLIKNQILSKGRIDRVLMKEIEQNGFDGFHKYIISKEQNLKFEKKATSLLEGDFITNLRFIKALDNYFLFIDYDSQCYALLDKRLTDKKPSTEEIYQAYVLSVKKRNDKRVFFISLDRESINPSLLPLINNGSLLEVSFIQSKDGIWHLVKNSCCKLLSLDIISRPKLVDYRKKQKAKILQQVDFFTYKIALL